MIHLMKHPYPVLTDSGGNQEEPPRGDTHNGAPHTTNVRKGSLPGFETVGPIAQVIKQKPCFAGEGGYHPCYRENPFAMDTRPPNCGRIAEISDLRPDPSVNKVTVRRTGLSVCYRDCKGGRPRLRSNTSQIRYNRSGYRGSHDP
jgi:hypothetical protein